jgi:hypothetical protein
MQIWKRRHDKNEVVVDLFLGGKDTYDIIEAKAQYGTLKV